MTEEVMEDQEVGSGEGRTQEPKDLGTGGCLLIFHPWSHHSLGIRLMGQGHLYRKFHKLYSEPLD